MTMKMDGTIHVQISKEYDEVYNSLKKGIGIDSHILFFLCFCIAVSKNLPPVPLKNKKDRFHSHTFTSQEWISMYSVILDQNDVNLKSIENDSEVIVQCEALANAGMAVFLQEIPQDCLRQNNGLVSVAVDDKGEMIKDILYLLLENYLDQSEEQ